MTVALVVVLLVFVVAAVGRRRIVVARTFAATTAEHAARRFLVVRRRRLRPPDDDDVAEWCEQVARGVRAGSSLSHAVVQAGAAAPAGATVFQPVVRAITRGRGLADALGELTDADPGSGVGLVVPVLAACAELGGPAALPLERVAAVLHGRSAERAERQANSAQARLSARVLTTLPVGVLALLAVAEPAVRTSLTTSLGVACLVAGAALNLAGWYWMRRLIGGAT
jgi:tight adherence protein B